MNSKRNGKYTTTIRNFVLLFSVSGTESQSANIQGTQEKFTRSWLIRPKKKDMQNRRQTNGHHACKEMNAFKLNLPLSANFGQKKRTTGSELTMLLLYADLSNAFYIWVCYYYVCISAFIYFFSFFVRMLATKRIAILLHLHAILWMERLNGIIASIYACEWKSVINV